MDDLSEKKKRLRRFRDSEKTVTLKIAGFRYIGEVLAENVKAVYSVKKSGIQRRKDIDIRQGEDRMKEERISNYVNYVKSGHNAF